MLQFPYGGIYVIISQANDAKHFVAGSNFQHQMSLVSAIIPTYNRENYLPRAIESVRNQTYQDIELIVVDDASDDATEELVADLKSGILEEGYPFSYLQHDENRGPAQARNTGISHATGKYVAFLDSDDWWLPSKVSRQVHLLESASQETAVSYSSHYKQDALGYRQETGIELFSGDVYEMLLRGWCPATTSLFMVRRNALEAVEGFKSGFVGFEDYDLWLRLARDYHFSCDRKPLVVKMFHTGDQLTSTTTERVRSLESFLQKWEAEMARIDSRASRRIYSEHMGLALWNESMRFIDKGDRKAALRKFISYLRLGRPTKLRTIEFLIGFVLGLKNRSRIEMAYKHLFWERVPGGATEIR